MRHTKYVELAFLLLASSLLLTSCRHTPEATEPSVVVARDSTTAERAAELVAAGDAALARRSAPALFESLDLYDRALAIAPDAAEALAGRSIAQSLLALYDALAPRAALGKALADAQRAVELDKQNASAQAAHGLALYLGPHRFDEATDALLRAIELAPRDPSAYHWLAMLESVTGEPAGSIEHIEVARALAPASLLYATKVATLRAAAGDLDGAHQALLACQEAFGDTALWNRETGWLMVRRGELKKAFAHFEIAAAKAPGNRGMAAAAAFAAARLGDQEHATAQVELFGEPAAGGSQQFRSKVPEAIVWSGLENKARALDALEQAFAEGDPGLIYLETQPAFKGLSSEPGFQSIVSQLGL